MEIESDNIDTKGYDFYWPVATNGYEWRNEDDLVFDAELHNSDIAHQRINPHWFHYERDALFYVVAGDSYHAPPTSLRERERPPAMIDTQPPWLVPKGSLELAQKQAISRPGPLDYQIPPTLQYQPLSDHVLHQKFAHLDSENLETEVIQFANQYGLLGRPVTLWSPEDDGAPDSFTDLYPDRYPTNTFRWNLPPNKHAIVRGESLFRWRGETEKMGVLLALWDLIRREEVSALGRLVHWLDNGSVDIRFKWHYQNKKYELTAWDGKTKTTGFGHHASIIASRRLLPEFFSEYRRGELIGPARMFLGGLIDLHLSGVRPYLTGIRMAETTFIPETLLDALWLLFMLEVYGTIRTCWHCGKAFEPARKDNVYCSNKCKRMAFYYAKQRKGGVQ